MNKEQGSLPLIMTVEELVSNVRGAGVANVHVDQGCAKVGGLVQIQSTTGKMLRVRILRLEQFGERLAEADAGSLVTIYFEDLPSSALKPGLIATGA